MLDSQTVYVVDDDVSIRRSLGRLLKSRGYEVHAYEDPRQLIEQPVEDPTACVLLDLDMPYIDGLQAQQLLVDRHPTLSVVILTGRGTVATSVQAMKDGAIDVLEKPVEQALLFGVVEHALDTGRRRWRRHREERETAARMSRLTAREREVFALIAKGFTNGEAGGLLGISRDTVKLHRARVMKKLEADSLADLVRMFHTAESA